MTDGKINMLDPKQQEKLEKPLRKPKEFMLQRLSLKYDKSLKSDYVVDSLDKGLYLINDYLADCPIECLVGIGLDSNKQPIACSILGMGNSGHVDMNYKNIFGFIFASGCEKIILVHNHPNAKELRPSNVDMQTFKEFTNILHKVGIAVGDFIITGNDNHKRAYYSYIENKVITQYDFLNHIKSTNIKNPIEVVDTSEKTIDEVNNLLAESKYNS